MDLLRVVAFLEYKPGAGFARQPKHRGVVRDRKDRNGSEWIGMDHDGPPIIPIRPIRPIFSDPPSFRCPIPCQLADLAA
jgi:hypothetical protein